MKAQGKTHRHADGGQGGRKRGLGVRGWVVGGWGWVSHTENVNTHRQMRRHEEFLCVCVAV